MPASSRLRTGTYWSWPPAESSERTCIFAWPLWSSRFPLREPGGRRHPGGEGFPTQLCCRARQARSDLRARCAARPGSSPLAGKRLRLQNPVQRAVIMAEGKRVTARDLELTDTLSALPLQTLKERGKVWNGRWSRTPYVDTEGRSTSAACGVGISRPTLYELMEKLGIAGIRDGRPNVPAGAAVLLNRLTTKTRRDATCKPHGQSGLPPNFKRNSEWLCRNPLQKQRGGFGTDALVL